MGGEIHYSVCLRCGMVLRNPNQTLARHHVARGPLGDLVIRAHNRRGCSVCGHHEVEVRWGIPPSLTSPSAARTASLGARRTFD
jgi:hypothetical protein